MTPAIQILQKHKIAYQLHEYAHDSNHASYGLEATELLSVSSKYIFKTLVTEADDGTMMVAVVPVGCKLNLKSLAKAVKVKKVSMAEPAKAQRITGYLLGAVSPLGQKRTLKTFIDISSSPLETMYVSAGKRGLEIELKPSDLQKLTGATVVGLT